MRQVVWWLVLGALVLVGSGPALSAEPPRDLDDYVVLGLRRTKLKNLTFIDSGAVGTNQARQVSSDGAQFGRRVFFNDGTSMVADYVRLGVGTSVYDVYANTFSAPRAVVRHTGPTTFSLPLVSPLPTLPAFAPGNTEVIVGDGEILTLSPGTYGAVRILNGATLALDPGTYELSTLLVGKKAKVLIYGPVLLNIAGDLRIGNSSTFGPAVGNLGPAQIQINVGGRRARFGSGANVTMYLFAPNAYLGIGRSVQAKGQFVAAIVNTDHSPTFSHPVCGDGTVDPGETCDDGNTTDCDGCSGTCTAESCGDGVVCGAAGETCDDGNFTACDGCSPTCQAEFCGDGVVCANEGESCDPPQCGVCGPTCTAGPTCGDGVLDATCGEACDDGNATSCDGCSPSCTVESCGDGEVCVGQGEQCDPPSVGGCALCDSTCQLSPQCGNGTVDAACGETCDDGNNVPCDGCTACQIDACGDGTTCSTSGEQCDDGNGTACDGCSPACQLDRCGDGTVCAGQGEVCDDGNITACDGCSSTCQAESCGDGVVCASLGEQCDDANAGTCDGCSNCTLETCGDGLVCTVLGEECDPPDLITCMDNCKLGNLPPNYCTHTQDDYGTPGGPADAQVTTPGVLPVTIGASGDLSLTVSDLSSLHCFLPTTGAVNLLCTGLLGCGGDMTINACTNPPILDPNGGFTASGGQGSGALAGETIALRLSVTLSDLGVTDPNLGNFVLQQAFCVKNNGTNQYFLIDPDIADGSRTVNDLLLLADQALRDGTSFRPADPITRQEISDALASVNEAFDGCRRLCSPSGAFIDEDLL